MPAMRSFRGPTRGLPTIAVGLIAVLAALLALPLTLAAHTEAFIYWTRGDGVTRAYLDGSGVDQMFITGADRSRLDFQDLAVDDAHLYWTGGIDRIGRANLDGSDVSEDFIVGTGDDFGIGSVTVHAEHVYWTHFACPEGHCVGAIGRANLDGSGVDPSFIDGIVPRDVAVDDSHIYWTNYGYAAPDTIGRANLDGTGIQTDFIGAPADGSSLLGSLAVDASHIYWTATGHVEGGSIGRAAIDGTNVDGDFIPTKAGHIAIDAHHIYWTEWDWPEDLKANYWIGRAALGGTAAGPLIDRPSYLALGIAVDDLTDTEIAGKASAAKTQKQRGKTVRVKLAVEAKEPLVAKARGKIKVDHAYKLKPESVRVVEGRDTYTQVETEPLELKPHKAAAKTIATALKHGDKATATLEVKLTDDAGNTKTEKLRVMLKR